MKLEVGKTYKTRDGRKAVVVGRIPENPLAYYGRAFAPVKGFIEDAPSTFSWNDDGVACDCSRLATAEYLARMRASLTRADNDLVAEWKEPVKKTAYVTMWDTPTPGAYHHVTIGDEDFIRGFSSHGYRLLAKREITITEGEGM